MAQINYGTPLRNDLNEMPPVPQSTFVPGLGMLGPDSEGYMKGALAKQKFMSNANQDARDEEQLGIAKEKLEMDRDYLKIAQEDLGIRYADLKLRQNADTREGTKFDLELMDKQKEMETEEGMEAAAQQGGYEGVIEYLKTADPEKAIMFHAGKLKLDAAIMSNETMSALLPVEKSKALLESYGIIGKIGQGILNAKPQDRQNMWDAIAPMRKQLFGDNGPQNLEEALPVFMLGVAQATPESQAFGLGKQSEALNSELGKTAVALSELSKAGKTLENDQLAHDLSEKYKALQTKDQMILAKASEFELTKKSSEVQMAKTKKEADLKQLNLDNTLSDRYEKESKKTRDFMEQRNNFYAAYKNYQDAKLTKDPKLTAAAQTAMNRTVGIMFNPAGAFADSDAVAFAAGDNILNQYLKDAKSLYSETGIVKANDKEVESLKTLLDSLTESRIPRQKEINDKYKSQLEQFHGSKNAINFIDLPQSQKDKPVPYNAQQLQQKAQEAIAKNPKRKDIIMQMLESDLQKLGK